MRRLAICVWIGAGIIIFAFLIPPYLQARAVKQAYERFVSVADVEKFARTPEGQAAIARIAQQARDRHAWEHGDKSKYAPWVWWGEGAEWNGDESQLISCVLRSHDFKREAEKYAETVLGYHVTLESYNWALNTLASCRYKAYRNLALLAGSGAILAGLVPIVERIKSVERRDCGSA
ncbi:MAG: hypothetical protein ACPLPR_04240 [Bacillota bacterium]